MSTANKRQLTGRIGAVCLLLIIPVKLVRLSNLSVLKIAVDIAPSGLGPIGLLLLLRSRTGRLARLTLFQLTLLVGAISIGLEVTQLLPRPGILARVSYTFDYLDLVATLIGLLMAYFIARFLTGEATSVQICGLKKSDR